MACFHPKDAYENLDGGSPVFHGDDSRAGNPLKLPCLKCIGCLTARKGDWALRCRHEARMHGENNCFVTLTYDADHLPVGGVLMHKHFQRFIRALRDDLKARRRARDPVRYFMCGEHGDSFGRAHFHVLLFGYWPCDSVMESRSGDIPKFTSASLERLWGRGFVLVERVGGGAFDYVSGHNEKKAAKLAAVNGEEWRLDGRHCLLRPDSLGRLRPLFDEEGDVVVWIPEYCRTSTHPGLGESFVQKYWSDMFPQGMVARHGGFLQRIPRYYRDLAAAGRLEESSFGYVDRSLVERQSEERKEFAKLRDPRELSESRLRQKEACAIDRFYKRKAGFI